MVNDVDTVLQVRRREIRDTDLDAVACLLARGFPGRDRGYWQTGLNRLAARPVLPAGCPRYGYLLETEAGPVGAVLLLCSETFENGEARIRCNASSWYTEPRYRMHAPLLIAAALKRRDVTYINVSPAPHTWATVEAQGFRAYASGQAVVCPMLAAAREPATVLLIGPGDREACDPADAALLTDHAALGCTSLVVQAADGAHPFVFLPFRMRSGRYPLPLMQLIYCREPERFHPLRCAAGSRTAAARLSGRRSRRRHAARRSRGAAAPSAVGANTIADRTAPASAISPIRNR